MKKLLVCLFLLFICFPIQNVSASDLEIKDINIHATIQEDGSARFVETWNMYVDEGTEVYKVFDNMEESKVDFLSVIDDLGTKYKKVDKWDVDLSKKEKDGFYGMIQDDDHYELCFGIGEYGQRSYTFEYTISDFVKQYTNDQGFNYAFLSQMSSSPRHVKVTLDSKYKFDQNNSQIYAFGYHGNVQFQDGAIVLETNQVLPEGGKVQLLMQINNGTFTNAYQKNQDFNDILEEAKNGSDYDQDNYDLGSSYNAFTYKEDKTWLYMFVGVFVFIIGATGVIGGYKYKASKAKYMFEDHTQLPVYSEVDMFREIPCDKDIFEFYYLASKLGLTDDNRSGLIAAVLLKWIQKGYITFEKVETKTLGVFKKNGFTIDFHRNIPCKNVLEETLLDYFLHAAGENKLLETKEFEKWCTKNYKKIDQFFDNIDTYIMDKYREEGKLKSEVIDVQYLHMTFKNDIYVYDLRVKNEMIHILGLKKFLKEMSLIHEKEVIEVKMWEEYLIFASILNIADEVEKQLGTLCPMFNEQSSLDTIYTMHMIHMFANNSMRASYNASQQARSSGMGGRASIGGGGSFSGGGGGGVR